MTTFDVFMQALVSGIATGAIYALIAVGVTLVFGVMRIVNFAHGEFLMLAMYGGYFCWALFGLDPLIAIFLVTPALALAGVLFYDVIVRHTLRAPEINQMAVTLGVSLLLHYGVGMLVTGDNLLVQLDRSIESIEIGSVLVFKSHLVVTVVSVILIGGLAVLLKATDLGLMMRAVAQSADGAALSGIELSRIYRYVLALGIGTLGVAGPLLVSTIYVTPSVGALFTLKAFVIVIVGGLGNFGGAIVGALIVGLAENIAAVWLSGSLAAVVPLALLIAIMLFKPEGLMNRVAVR